MQGTVEELTFWEHVGSLRSHLLIGAIIFAVVTVASFSFMGALMAAVLRPFGGQDLVFLTVLGPFLFQMKLAFLVAFVASAGPWVAILFHFAAPALEGRGGRAFAAFTLSAMLMAVLALIGTYFYLFPMTLHALLSSSVPGTRVLLTADSYLDFFWMETLVACIVLELPVIIALLAYLRVLNPKKLASKRPLLYIGLTVIMAVVTPTTDLVSLLVVLVPSVLSLEIGLLIARAIHTRAVRDAAHGG